MVCTSDIIQFEDLPPHILEFTTSLAEQAKEKNHRGEDSPLQNAESEVLRAALIKNNWNKQETALALNISRSTLWRKMKRYRIYPED